jgi:hypothetical protein
MKTQLVIFVQGGIVQDIHGQLAPNCEDVIIIDYDIQGASPDAISKCPWSGEDCLIGHPVIQNPLPYRTL